MYDDIFKYKNIAVVIDNMIHSNQNYLPELADKVRYHMSNKHNNHLLWVLKVYHNFHRYKKIDKHQ